MSPETRKIKMKKGTAPVTDLAEDYPDEEAEIITLVRRLYRVRKDILNSRPQDYTPWRFGEALPMRYCVICAFQLGLHPLELNSPWLPPEEHRCIVHCRPTDGRNLSRRPYCPYCAEPMSCVLPVEVAVCQTRFIWICEGGHCHLLTETMEGVE
jgi:hypothetical protein